MICNVSLHGLACHFYSNTFCIGRVCYVCVFALRYLSFPYDGPSPSEFSVFFHGFIALTDLGPLAVCSLALLYHQYCRNSSQALSSCMLCARKLPLQPDLARWPTIVRRKLCIITLPHIRIYRPQSQKKKSSISNIAHYTLARLNPCRVFASALAHFVAVTQFQNNTPRLAEPR